MRRKRLTQDAGPRERLRQGFIRRMGLYTGIFLFGAPVVSYRFVMWSVRNGYPEAIDPKRCIAEGIYAAVIRSSRFGAAFLLCLVGYLFSIMLAYSEYMQKRNMRADEEHGSGALMKASEMGLFYQRFFYDPEVVRRVVPGVKTEYDRKELKEVCRMSGRGWRRIRGSRRVFAECFRNSQILGEGVYLSMNCRFINRNLNTLTIGGSGQGKTYSELLSNALNANCNYVFTDPSGEILKKTGRYLEKQGYELRVFNVDDFSLSQKYNPLCYLESEKDYNTLVDALNRNIKPDKKGGGSNEFFDDAKDSLLCALIALLCELFYDEPEKLTMANVMELLRMAERQASEGREEISALDSLFSELLYVNPRSYAARMWENFKVGGPKVCNEVIISAAAVYGRYFDTDEVAFLTSRDELSLYDLAGERKIALFLIIPQASSSYNFLVSMVYSQLFDIVMRCGKARMEREGLSAPALPRHLAFWLDEFSNCGKIPNFLQMLSVVRKYNISVNLIVQGLSQLKGMYPREEWETILANLDTMIYLGGMEPSTVKWLSEKLGKETIRQMSQSSGKGGGSRSYSNIGRALMTADEIERMTRAEELIFISGCKPIRTRKFDLREHPAFSECGEADPSRVFDVAGRFYRGEVDYEALERARVKMKDLLKYDFKRVRLKRGVVPGEMVV